METKHRIYFVGIAGTGMASAAGLLKAAGYDVKGSDSQVYPPMSHMLADQHIPVFMPYGVNNLEANPADIYVIGNAMSRGHVGVEWVLEKKKPYTSFPQTIGELFLSQRTPIVVAGTHGKTTTTSLLTHLLDELGAKPGYLIGGLPKGYDRSFDPGQGKLFVIEGDEYDTCFFDKESKFLHYRPAYCVLNNLEYDHVDIFPNLEAVEAMFAKLIALVPDKKRIIANTDDPGLHKLLTQLGLMDQITRNSGYGRDNLAAVTLLNLDIDRSDAANPKWCGELQTRTWGRLTLTSELAGAHNWANISQALTVLQTLVADGQLPLPTAAAVQAAFASFRGVRRRLELLVTHRDIAVYEDFAHHPTAVGQVIAGFRRMHPEKRLIIAFEPRNATSRRNVFQDRFATELAAADAILVGPCHVDQRIPVDQRLDTAELTRAIGDKGHCFSDNEDLYSWLVANIRTNDAVIFMTPGSFSGIHHRLVEHVKSL